MRFMMFVATDPDAEPYDPREDNIKEWVARHDASGRRITGNRLRPAKDATTVRRRAGKILVTDGPFAETRELIGGFDILECANLEEAIAIAAEHPMARYGRLELRAFWPIEEPGAAEHVAGKPAFELVMERVVAAPRPRVFEAWTTPEQMVQWFAPKPFKLKIESIDVRPGGRFSMAMEGPGGDAFPFSGTYRDIVAPAKLVWTGEFAGGPADQISTVVTFDEAGQKTAIHVRQTFLVMTPEAEWATKGAKQGWAMTLDQLESFCAAEPGTGAPGTSRAKSS